MDLISIPLSDKICTAEEAVSLIKDNDTIASEGFTLFFAGGSIK